MSRIDGSSLYDVKVIFLMVYFGVYVKIPLRFVVNVCVLEVIKIVFGM